MNRPKQVIIIRKDLRNTKGHKIRSGKIASQIAHASLANILQLMKKVYSTNGNRLELDIKKDSNLDKWINDKFTKVTLQCKSEEELLDLYEKAKELGLNVSLITDSGFTEFGGVATNTCIAIGPDDPIYIDSITGHLSLM